MLNAKLQSMHRSVEVSIFYKIVCVFVMLFLGSQASFAQKIGMIQSVHGDVWLMEEGKVWRLQQGDEVNRDHTIVTEEKSVASVELVDGSMLNVGANTRLKLQQYVQETSQASSMNFNVLWGNVRYFVKKIIDPNAAFNVKTTTAAIGVRGTEFEVRMPYPDNVSGLRFSPSASLFNIGLQTTTVDMEEGLVVLTDLKGNEHELPAGTVTTVDAESNVVQVVKGAPVVQPRPVEIPQPTVSMQKFAANAQQAGSQAAITTGANASAIQNVTITPPRFSTVGGR
ncbi:MAG TPA: hypothetical protein EYP39_02810 [Ghiorsea sp.]|nr:hypothetical protein [Ghiorsea sp.]HIP06489.1 hypothetical protein [Mariprofundaceae bacterium]